MTSSDRRMTNPDAGTTGGTTTGPRESVTGPRESVTGSAGTAGGRPGWTFLSNHAHVLTYLDRDCDATMREIADRVGITLRAVQKIVADLAADGYLKVERRGRRNHYAVDGARPLRHPLERHATVRELLDAVAVPPAAGQARRQRGWL